MSPIIRSIFAGAFWAILLATLSARAPWYWTAGILASGPLIGLAIYAVSKWTYKSVVIIAFWTVPSVYCAAAIFGLVTGLLDSVARGTRMILDGMVWTLYGITVPSPFWLLFPLAFATHLWVRAGDFSNRSPAPGAVH